MAMQGSTPEIPLSRASREQVTIPDPSGLYLYFETAVDARSALDIHDITKAERPVLARTTQDILREIVESHDTEQTQSTEGPIRRSELLPPLVVSRKLSEHYDFYSRRGVDLTVAARHAKFKTDYELAKRHIVKYPEIRLAMKLYSELGVRGRKDAMAAGAVLDLLCAYGASASVVIPLGQSAVRPVNH